CKNNHLLTQHKYLFFLLSYVFTISYFLMFLHLGYHIVTTHFLGRLVGGGLGLALWITSSNKLIKFERYEYYIDIYFKTGEVTMYRIVEYHHQFTVPVYQQAATIFTNFFIASIQHLLLWAATLLRKKYILATTTDMGHRELHKAKNTSRPLGHIITLYERYN
ncbi:hypothetical protein ACJX0J_026490, partial [Zea mays]